MYFCITLRDRERKLSGRNEGIGAGGDDQATTAAPGNASQRTHGYGFAGRSQTGKSIACRPATIGQRHHGYGASAVGMGKNGLAESLPAGDDQVHGFVARHTDGQQGIQRGLVLGMNHDGDISAGMGLGRFGAHRLFLLVKRRWHKAQSSPCVKPSQ